MAATRASGGTGTNLVALGSAPWTRRCPSRCPTPDCRTTRVRSRSGRRRQRTARWCAPRRERACYASGVVRTMRRPRRVYSRRRRESWQTHSGRLPAEHLRDADDGAGRPFLKELGAADSPTLKSASPKSAWAVPGGQIHPEPLALAAPFRPASILRTRVRWTQRRRRPPPQ